MFSAIACYAPWQDLATFGYILSQAAVIFIVNKLYFINAKAAYLFFLYSFRFQASIASFQLEGYSVTLYLIIYTRIETKVRIHTVKT